MYIVLEIYRKKMSYMKIVYRTTKNSEFSNYKERQKNKPFGEFFTITGYFLFFSTRLILCNVTSI